MTSSGYDISIQPGHIARHTPRNAGAQGREAAVVDIAQDLLLRHLHDEGVIDNVAIKGGTAIRKLYAGNEGRFSLDLDFAVSEVGLDREEAALSFAAAIDGIEIGPFRYGVRERRGKWSVTFSSRFVDEPTLATATSCSKWRLPSGRRSPTHSRRARSRTGAPRPASTASSGITRRSPARARGSSGTSGGRRLAQVVHGAVKADEEARRRTSTLKLFAIALDGLLEARKRKNSLSHVQWRRNHRHLRPVQGKCGPLHLPGLHSREVEEGLRD